MTSETADAMLLADADATRAAGAALAVALKARGTESPPLRIALHGELGAGKTTLVGGLLAALGHRGPVRSPTYTLLEPYQLAGLELHHCDLYRLASPEAVAELGLRDLLVPGAVLLVEWPERAGALLEPWDLALALDYAGEGRRLRASAGSAAGRALAGALQSHLDR
jgi:tRNA threonylcarbamoyladenosine biosynthesis protein TsaE